MRIMRPYYNIIESNVLGRVISHYVDWPALVKTLVWPFLVLRWVTIQVFSDL